MSVAQNIKYQDKFDQQLNLHQRRTSKRESQSVAFLQKKFQMNKKQLNEVQNKNQRYEKQKYLREIESDLYQKKFKLQRQPLIVERQIQDLDTNWYCFSFNKEQQEEYVIRVQDSDRLLEQDRHSFMTQRQKNIQKRIPYQKLYRQENNFGNTIAKVHLSMDCRKIRYHKHDTPSEKLEYLCDQSQKTYQKYKPQIRSRVVFENNQIKRIYGSSFVKKNDNKMLDSMQYLNPYLKQQLQEKISQDYRKFKIKINKQQINRIQNLEKANQLIEIKNNQYYDEQMATLNNKFDFGKKKILTYKQFMNLDQESYKENQETHHHSQNQKSSQNSSISEIESSKEEKSTHYEI